MKIIPGTASVVIQGTDTTYDGTVLLGTEVPPVAPAPQGPVVSDVVVSNIDSTWTGNDTKGGNV